MIQITSCKDLNGRDPPQLLDYVTGSTEDETLNNTLQQQQQVLTELKSYLKRNKTAMEK